MSCLWRRRPKVPSWPLLTPKEALTLLASADAPLKPGEDAVAVVSAFGLGPFQRQPLVFETEEDSGEEERDELMSDTLTVNETATKGGPVVGFGGAFTDAAVVNLGTAQDSGAAVEWLFSPKGMGYSLTRVHIGSCDFCVRNYTYVTDASDLACATFRLQPEDEERLQWLHRAKAACGDRLKILASPWTAPPWMKSGAGGPSGYVGGALRRESSVYQAWAQLFAKFLSAYAAAGLPVWAVTPQNEPNALPVMLRQTWETMFWDTREMVRFIGRFLGPTLAKEHPEVLIVAHDDQRLDMPHFIRALAADPVALRYVGGIGFHWYQYPPKPYGAGGFVNLLWRLGSLSTALPHESYCHIGESRRLMDQLGRQDAMLVCTEMCTGFSEVLSPPTLGPSIGDWDRAEVYAEEILRSLSEGMLAWLDWNLVLDDMGGPNWAGNMCDAPLICMPGGQLLLQPMCVAIAHFSHFIVPGSLRLIVGGTQWDTPSGVQAVHAVAFACGRRAVLLLVHRSPELRRMRIRVPGRGILRLHLPGHSVATVCWPLTAAPDAT